MTRGTTPHHTFELPFDVLLVKKAVVIYAQNGAEVLRKETDSCTLDGNTIKTALTQEETFMFDEKKSVQIQVRVLTIGDEALASNIMTVDIGKLLDDEVLK